MTLIKSISGIRGTIGGHVSDGLNPVSTAQFTAAYASFIRQQTKKGSPPDHRGERCPHLWHYGQPHRHGDAPRNGM